MANYIIVGIISGILFAVMDGAINANPLAQRLNRVFQPIAKKSLNMIAGVLIDLAYGFVMAGVFLLLYESLPGETGLIKGILFATMVWFFRVVMSAVSQWMMYSIPAGTLIYSILTGLAQMIITGGLYGLFLRPTS